MCKICFKVCETICKVLDIIKKEVYSFLIITPYSILFFFILIILNNDNYYNIYNIYDKKILDKNMICASIEAVLIVIFLLSMYYYFRNKTQLIKKQKIIKKIYKRDVILAFLGFQLLDKKILLINRLFDKISSIFFAFAITTLSIVIIMMFEPFFTGNSYFKICDSAYVSVWICNTVYILILGLLLTFNLFIFGLLFKIISTFYNNKDMHDILSNEMEKIIASFFIFIIFFFLLMLLVNIMKWIISYTGSIS